MCRFFLYLFVCLFVFFFSTIWYKYSKKTEKGKEKWKGKWFVIQKWLDKKEKKNSKRKKNISFMYIFFSFWKIDERKYWNSRIFYENILYFSFIISLENWIKYVDFFVVKWKNKKTKWENFLLETIFKEYIVLFFYYFVGKSM